MSSIAATYSLFEIDAELDGLLEAIEEEIASNGQASPERIALFQEFLNAHGDKVDRIGRFVRCMDARITHCRVESQRLSDRARNSENKIARTKSMILYYLKSRGLRKVEGLEFTLRRQSNSQDSVAISDEDLIPLEYKTVALEVNGHLWMELLDSVPEELRPILKNSVRETIPDNNAIRLADSRQEVVPGAQVKRGEHVRIV